MNVWKFGGTSVGSAERMHNLVSIIDDKQTKIVVLSAMSGTTNALVEIANSLYAKENEKANSLIDALEKKYKQVIKELYSKEDSLKKGEDLIKMHFDHLRSFTLDMFTANEEKAILAQGELLSTAMFHYYLEEIGKKSVLLPALNFMRIDENDEPDLNYIEEHIKKELTKYTDGYLFITQGYICRNAFGEIDNLKRGGSDYTATLIGAAIRSEEIQIWTDIDGMHNNDPRIVEKTFPVTELSFDEAAELAYFRSKDFTSDLCVASAEKKSSCKIAEYNAAESKGNIDKRFCNRRSHNCCCCERRHYCNKYPFGTNAFSLWFFTFGI